MSTPSGLTWFASEGASLRPRHARALVTLTVGRRYRERWTRLCQANWEAYARRHGYDLLCLDQPLDSSPRAQGRSPAWQKCLVLGQPFAAQYERLVWLDADLLLNPRAPDVSAGVPPDRVGAVDEFSIPTPDLHRRTIAKLYHYWEARGVPFIRNAAPEEYYTVYGLPRGFPNVVQTGVMVLSPQAHREILERTYCTYEDRGPEWNFEMRPLSYELLTAGLVHWLDPRFNYIWGLYQAQHLPFLLNQLEHPDARRYITRALRDVYILHFAGAAAQMQAVETEELETREPEADTRLTPHTAPDRSSLKTPVALFIFARPETTAQVLAVLRRARPTRLYVVADGPRPDQPGEAERCAAARALVDSVDWDCTVETHYAGTNLGVRRRIETGLDWVFARETEAILLEDDCLPHLDFFPFCQELLQRYHDDPRVLCISGNQFLPDRPATPSYTFSRYPLIWGWATWRRAWQRHDPEMTAWPRLRDSRWLEEVFHDRLAVSYWTHLLDKTYRGEIDTWDYRLSFTSWLHGLVNIVPRANLVSNIGFGPEATHTRQGPGALFSNLPTEPLTFPLSHPVEVARDTALDTRIEETLFSGNLGRHLQRLHRQRLG